MDFLPKKILEKPPARKKEEIGNSKKSIVTESSDKYYRVNKSFKGWISWITGIILIIIPTLMLLFLKKDNFWPKVIFWIIFGLPGILIIIYGFIAPAKEMIYHRLKGVLTITRPFRKSVDISFKTGYGVRVYTSHRPGLIDTHLSFVSSMKKPRVGGILSELKVDNYWAFTVWYMDKNRPLPPGDAFDPYREKDFERRKAEGFPKPLYKSNIPTPEFTKVQQQERERIGGW
jgi:hypothetical protein